MSQVRNWPGKQVFDIWWNFRQPRWANKRWPFPSKFLTSHYLWCKFSVTFSTRMHLYVCSGSHGMAGDSQFCFVISSACSVVYWLNYYFTKVKVADPSGRAKAWIYRHSLTEITGSNPTQGLDVRLLWVLCVVRYGPLRRADPSYRGVLPHVGVCHCVWSSATVTSTPTVSR